MPQPRTTGERGLNSAWRKGDRHWAAAAQRSSCMPTPSVTMPVAFITHPSCLLHEMGPYHPECPERLSAVGDRMIAAGIDAYLRHFTAGEATREQIGRVHSATFIDEIEAASPQTGLHYIDP